MEAFLASARQLALGLPAALLWFTSEADRDDPVARLIADTLAAAVPGYLRHAETLGLI